MSAPPPSPPKDLLAGRYRLLDALGSGGTSAVYRAWDEESGDFRAVKILDGTVAHNPRIRQRLLQEAEVMAHLQHPNVVRLHHAGADGDVLYIVMELMLGGSIMERLDADGPLPPRMAAHVLGGALDALQLAHDNGIVHRDVKPHNILLDGSGTPKVTDFGIARWEDGGLTRTGAVLGTLAYMPPEQKLSARTVDLRSDVYAAGATLYAFLTGRMPHDLYAAGLDPTIAGEVFEGLPPALSEVVRRATQFRVTDRYASALAMKAALAAAVADLPDDPPGPPLVSPGRLGVARSKVRLGPTLLGTTESAEVTFEQVRPVPRSPRPAEPRTPEVAGHAGPPRRAAVPGVGVLLVGMIGLVAIGSAVWTLSPAEADPGAMAILPPIRSVSSRPVLEPGMSVLTLDPSVAAAPEPEAPASPLRPRRRSAPRSDAIAVSEDQEPVEAYRQTVGRWRVERWPTGKSRADVIATLPSDAEVVGPDGARLRPELVLRCDARRPIAALRTGLTTVVSERRGVELTLAGPFADQVELEPDPSLGGELLFPKPADWIDRLLGARSPIRFTWGASTAVFTVGDAADVAAALESCL